MFPTVPTVIGYVTHHGHVTQAVQQVSPGSFDGNLGQETFTLLVVKLIGPRPGAASDRVGTPEGRHA